GHGRKARRIVHAGEVCRLLRPAATSLRKFFALLFECIDPLPENCGFIHSGLERAVAVAVLRHFSNARDPEEILDLMVGELAHQSRGEAAAFFTNRWVPQTVFRTQTLAQRGLTHRTFRPAVASGADFFPKLLAGPLFQIHLGGAVTRKPA